jgi:hypothetical protein
MIIGKDNPSMNSKLMDLRNQEAMCNCRRPHGMRLTQEWSKRRAELGDKVELQDDIEESDNEREALSEADACVVDVVDANLGFTNRDLHT